ncbi:unnamed protein product [Ophioblennius macclurei]
MAADYTEGGEDQQDHEEKMDVEAHASEDESVETATSALEAQSPELPEEVNDRSRWKLSVIYLCTYGFVASIKPGEPFITPLLLSSEKNFTKEQVTNEITPVLTYSYMAVLVPAFLLTDLLRYKPLLILQCLSQMAIWLILLLGTTLLQMQFMEFFYGITMACRLAYSSYIFSLVDPAFYQRVASYSRSSVLFGVFLSAVLGQLCMSVGKFTYFSLNAISMGFVCFSLLLSLCLPWPKRSLFFNRTKQQEQREQAALAESELDTMNPKEEVSATASWWKDSIFLQMLLELKNVVRRPNLRLWSLWWVFNSTGYYLVLFYVHILWNAVQEKSDNVKVYNGAVEAASTLLSAVVSFMAGYVKIRWNVWSELVIGLITAVQASLLLVMQNTDNIWVCYVTYVLFRGFYQFLVPIATFQIASSLSKELCALVFGINTFLATILKTIINLIFSDKRVLGLPVQDQFLVYFIYMAILTVIYLVCAAVNIFRHFRRQPGAEDGAGEQATPTELGVLSLNSEEQPLSNGKGVKA